MYRPEDITRQNILKLKEIKEFCTADMRDFLDSMIDVEERFGFIRETIDASVRLGRNLPPIPSLTLSLKTTLAESNKNYLRVVQEAGDNTHYLEAVKIIKSYMTFLKTDKDNRAAILHAYSKGHNTEVAILMYFDNFIEIHKMLLNTLFNEYHFIQSKFKKDFSAKTVESLNMLPSNFNPSDKKTSSKDDEETGIAK